MDLKIKAGVLAAASALFFSSAATALDRESLDCLSCHDAVIASDVIMRVCGGLPECDHPVGVDYFFVSARNPSLRAPSNLIPEIRLIGGVQIGCGTCHVPYSPINHLALSVQRRSYPAVPDPTLVMENRKSELCLGCHLK